MGIVGLDGIDDVFGWCMEAIVGVNAKNGVVLGPTMVVPRDEGNDYHQEVQVNKANKGKLLRGGRWHEVDQDEEKAAGTDGLPMSPPMLGSNDAPPSKFMEMTSAMGLQADVSNIETKSGGGKTKEGIAKCDILGVEQDTSSCKDGGGHCVVIDAPDLGCQQVQFQMG